MTVEQSTPEMAPPGGDHAPGPDAAGSGWGRRLRRFVLWALAAVAVLFAVGWFVLESDWLREKVRATVEVRASEALGTDVSLGPIDFSLFALSAVAEDIVVSGPEGADEPLAVIPRLTIQLGPGVVGALRGKRPLVLSEILVERPLFDLRFYEDGSSNLPDLPESGDSEGGIEVRLASLHVSDGTFVLDQRELPLEFAARDLRASLREVDDGAHLVQAESSAVSLLLPEAESLAAAMNLRARIADGKVTLERTHLEAAHLNAAATGEVGAEGFDLAIEGSLDATLLEELGWLEDVTGRADVELEMMQAEGEWSLAGTFTSPGIGMGEYEVTDVAGSLAGDPVELTVWLESGRFAGATLSGETVVSLGGDTVPIVVRADLAGLEVARLLGDEEPVLVGIESIASGSLEYRFEASAPQAGDGGGVLELMAPASSSDDSEIVSLAGDAAFTIAGGVLTFDQATVTAPGQRLALTLAIDLAALSGDGSFVLETSDPRALLRTVPALREGEEEPWQPSRGRGEVAGTFSFDGAGFTTDLTLDLEALIVAGAPVARGTGEMVVDSAGVQHLDLTLTHQGAELGVVGAIPFEPSPGGESDLQHSAHQYSAPDLSIAVHAESWRLGDAEAWLDMEFPVSAVVTGDVTLEGSLEEPRGLVTVRLEEIVAGETEIPGVVEGRIAYAPDRVDVGPLRHTSGAGEIELIGTFDPSSQALDLEMVSSPLDLASPVVDQWVAGDLSGWLDLAGSLTGTVEEPTLDLIVTATGVDLAGASLGESGTSSARLSLEGGELEVDGSLLGLVSLSGGGTVSTAGVDVAIGIESAAVPELMSLGMDEPLQDLVGLLSGELVLTGSGEDLLTRLTLSAVELTRGERHLANLEPVEIVLGEEGIDLELLYLGEVGTENYLAMSGTLVSPEGEMDLGLQSSIDSSWLTPFLEDIELEGRLQLLTTVRGAPTAPKLNGQAQVVDGSMIVADFPHAVEDIEALIFLYSDPGQIVIDSGEARFARGRLTADGTVVLPEGGREMSYELRLRGTDLDIRYPEDWQLRADGQLTLSSSDRGRLLTGTIEVDRASFVRDFDLGFTGLMRAMFQRQPEIVGETDEFLLETRLNINVVGEDALQVKTNIATLWGDLDFTVRGNAAHPIILGDIRLGRGGQIAFGGTQYRLERGNLVFSNPFRNDPNVDLVASARVREYDIRLNVFGPLGDLQTSASSSPPLPSLDVVSLLTTGTADTFDSFGSSSLLESGESTTNAESFLASQAASIAGQRVGTLFGLDQVQITPLSGATSELSTARITVGKRISRDVFVTYAYDPSSNDEEVFEIAWQVYPSISIVLSQMDQDSYIVDIRWSKTF